MRRPGRGALPPRAAGARLGLRVREPLERRRLLRPLPAWQDRQAVRGREHRDRARAPATGCVRTAAVEPAPRPHPRHAGLHGGDGRGARRHRAVRLRPAARRPRRRDPQRPPDPRRRAGDGDPGERRRASASRRGAFSATRGRASPRCSPRTAGCSTPGCRRAAPVLERRGDRARAPGGAHAGHRDSRPGGGTQPAARDADRLRGPPAGHGGRRPRSPTATTRWRACASCS